MAINDKSRPENFRNRDDIEGYMMGHVNALLQLAHNDTPATSMQLLGFRIELTAIVRRLLHDVYEDANE